jgi:6-pyruvoyltetrahydropterin/6-carboxytetrahydropterin synthase
VTDDAARLNTFASWPAPMGLAAWYELDVAIDGEPSSDTGYLLGIDVIDRVVRSEALPILRTAFEATTTVEPAQVLLEIASALDAAMNETVQEVRWRLTPRHELGWRRVDTAQQKDMTMHDPPIILIRERFEFSAAHRLHCPDRSDEWNRETFGKCNNPNGHGHNYEIEVAIASPVGSSGEAAVGIEILERIVDREIISRFDHRHLNEDCPEFANLNPSVENITMICHQLLQQVISEAGGRLDAVTVWETGKTSCTYPAPAT